MNWNLLPVFVAVAEASNFSLAAAKLGLRPSSVSRAISTLEEMLGVQLFNRTTRQTVLTAAGAALHAKVAPRFGELAAELGALPERKTELSGLLRVTAPNDVGATVLPGIVAAFASRFPGIQVDVRITNKQVDLVADAVDVAFRVSGGALRDSTLVARKLSEFEGHAVASPTYLARMLGPPQTPRDAGRYDWVAIPGRVPKEFGARPEKVVVLGDDMLFLRGLAVSGAGLAVLPAFLIDEDLTAGRLVRVLPRLKAPSGVLYFVHTPAKHLPRRVTMFRDFAVQHFATHRWVAGLPAPRGAR